MKNKLFWLAAAVFFVTFVVAPSQANAQLYKKIPIMKASKSCSLYSDLWRCYVKRVPKKDQIIYKLIVAQIKLWRLLYKNTKKNKTAKKALEKSCKTSVKFTEIFFKPNAYARHCKKYVTGKLPSVILFDDDVWR